MAHTPSAKRAVGFAEKAAQLSNYQAPSVLDTLAVIYAEASQLKKA